MDTSAISQILLSLGVNIASSALYDFLRRFGSLYPNPSVADFESELQSFLDISGVSVTAGTVIEMMARKGLMLIQNSTLYAPEQVTIAALRGASFVFGNGSVISTSRTSIVTNAGGQIVGTNSAIRQNSDGSISFLVGKE